MLTNHIRLVLDMQIILPPWELQVHVAKDNGILRDVVSKKKFFQVKEKLGKFVLIQGKLKILRR